MIDNYAGAKLQKVLFSTLPLPETGMCGIQMQPYVAIKACMLDIHSTQTGG